MISAEASPTNRASVAAILGFGPAIVISSRTRISDWAALTDRADRKAAWRILAACARRSPRQGRVGIAAAAPVRGTRRPLPGAPGALLAPGLLSAAGDLGARLGLARAQAAVGQLPHQRLMH
jgi:hypothetical protein